MRMTLTGVLAAAVLAGGIALADTKGNETYDMVFRTGTLDGVPRSAALVYVREVTNTMQPEAAEAGTGTVRLDFAGEKADQARLRFEQGEKYRPIGAFPAEVGNPVVMYFMETVVRDMSQSIGGSPFYIRNRLKEALVRGAEVAEIAAPFDGHDVAARALTMHPFANDPNRARMGGFDEMAVTVTMSDEVPGWYQSLSATVPGTEEGAPLYASTLTLEALDMEAAQ